MPPKRPTIKPQAGPKPKETPKIRADLKKLHQQARIIIDALKKCKDHKSIYKVLKKIKFVHPTSKDKLAWMMKNGKEWPENRKDIGIHGRRINATTRVLGWYGDTEVRQFSGFTYAYDGLRIWALKALEIKNGNIFGKEISDRGTEYYSKITRLYDSFKDLRRNFSSKTHNKFDRFARISDITSKPILKDLTQSGIIDENKLKSDQKYKYLVSLHLYNFLRDQSVDIQFKKQGSTYVLANWNRLKKSFDYGNFKRKLKKEL